MCGITGILAFEANAPFLNPHLIDRMRDTMVHRGPDEAGRLIDSHIALGQRRLSIIDLAGGSQPMSDAEERIQVLNNGELYNYREERRLLESQGYDFRTDSDTEILIHGYLAYGDEVIHHLRGMFAAAIWDTRQKRLLLARDRTGQKPLYYAHLPEGLFFASEIKALLQYESLPRDLDFQALSDYFTFQSIPEPLTIFKHIHKLPPGHLLTCDIKENFDIRRYWRWSIHRQETTKLSYQDAVAELRHQLEEAVRLRLISDVPLGALLSGGVDSSAIVTMMSRHATGAVKTFSIGFSHADYDERPFAREVAEFCDTEHEELLVEPENIRDILPRLAQQYDEPFADISALPTYYVCKLARQHVTVALAGDGGDESFGGYERHAKFLRLAQQFDRIPMAARKLTAGLITAALPMGIFGQRTLRLIATPRQERYQRMNSIFEYPHLQKLLPGNARPPRPLFTQRFQEFPELPLLSQLQLADLELYLASTILVKVDRASMLNSLEARAPLLDHHLLDFVGTLPPKWVFGKRILKDSIRGLVPERVLNRPKAGFAVPLEHWFAGDFGTFLRDILLDGATSRHGLLNRTYIDTLIRRQEKPWAELTTHLWAILMFELWSREYLI